METKKTVLVVSPDPELRAFCARALAGADISLRLAESLGEGTSRIKKERADVAIVDRVLFSRDPGLPGSLLRQEGVEWILIGHASGDEVRKAEEAGAWDVVPAAVSPEILNLRVRRALENGTARRELKRLQGFEHDISRLWMVAKGELESAELFDKEFVVPAAFAFRLTIAHEFRAPLTALQSFLLLVAKGYAPPEQQPELLQMAMDRAEDLLRLVDNLMNLATARQDLSPENRKRLSMGEELEKTVVTQKVEAEAKGLAFTVDVRGDPEVSANPHQVRQLWTNLISNAIKYTPAGGKITVRVDRDESWAIGSVEDTGIGFTREEQALLFHEFYRTAGAKKMERRGTGLGLALVRRIVEGYGGRVEAESTHGEGSRFRFTLPLAK
ncbi:MAG TPA: ATP-binding protein [Thermodesulfobacteriota bacterium]|nr:ATP-binding protein [Thermodesulfobacteriota bacterium]